MDDAIVWGVIAVLLSCLAGCMVLYAEEEGLQENIAAFEGRPVRAWLEDLSSEDRTAVRDAFEALGTMGPANDDAVPELAKALRDPNPLVRAGAARALGRIGPAARPALPALESIGELGYGPDMREALQARSRIEGSAKNAERPSAAAETP